MRRVHEAATKSKAPYGDVTYADPGYQPDKKKRYPLDTEKHVRAAWSYINQADNAKPYSASQLKAIKGRIKAAAPKFDIKIDDSWLYAGQELTEAEVAEHYAYGYGYEDGASAPGTFCFNATNGPISVSISSYCIDPADLEVVTRAACDAITTALKGLDPDMDGDIDLPGDPPSGINNDGDQMETVNNQAAPVAVTEEEATVADTTVKTEGATEAAPATETATAPVVDVKAIAEAAAMAAAQAVLAAQAAVKAEDSKTDDAATTETKQDATSESADTATADKAQLREGIKDLVRELLTESGDIRPTRKGYGVTEQADAGPNPQELWDKRGELFVAAAREAQQLGLGNREPATA